MNLTALYRAHGIHALREVARKSGLGDKFLYQIAIGFRRASPKTAIRIEQATSGEIPRWELRPDLWSPPKEGEAATGLSGEHPEGSHHATG
ncbi:MAG: YdaS family helix-turn-helix protein [Acidithiobacillus sp.]